ncbi:MAG: hypothetical protein R3B47_09885 [Bacteroidia bacterium]
MKSTKAMFAVLAVFAAMLFTSSCLEKEEIVTLTEQEAVYLVEAAVQDESAGTTYMMEASSEELVASSSLNDVCDSLFQKAWQYNHNGTRAQANYAAGFSYQFSCNAAKIPTSAHIDYAQSGTFAGLRLSGADSASCSIDIAGLQPSATLLVFDGSYGRSGTHDFSANNKRNINSTISLTLTQVEMDKSSYEITSGSGTFSLTGSTQNGSFSYKGTIVFNGNKQATITINGNTYQIDLN